MKVETVNFRKVNKGNLKAFATVKFDNSFIIRGIKILSGKTGTYVGWPSQEYIDKDGNKQYPLIVACENEDLYKSINSQILEEFAKSGGGSSGSSGYGGKRTGNKYGNKYNNNSNNEEIF